MKSKIRLLPTTLASLVMLSSGIGIESAQAQFSNRRSQRPQSFPEAAERWGYECQRRHSGYFCTSNDRRNDDRFDQRDDRFDRGQFHQGRVYEGRTIRTTAKNRDRILIRKNDSRELTLYVDEDIRADDTGRIIIPRDSRIEGRLRARDGGIQFEAKRLTLSNGRRYNLDAQSEIIYANRRVASRRTTTTDAARVVLSTILGDRKQRDGDVDRRDDDFGSRDDRERDLIVVYPDRDLNLRLRKDLKID